MEQGIIRDPTGFEVILTEGCWSDHVIKHHKEMVPFRERVIETLRSPDGIYLGKRDPSRRIYSKKYPEVPGVGHWLDLLVFVKGSDGYVATAYFAFQSFRMLGEQIWPSK